MSGTNVISGFISLENEGIMFKYITLETVDNQRILEKIYDQSLLDPTWAVPFEHRLIV